jgi:transcriptional regulator with XRE-family HTH domain
MATNNLKQILTSEGLTQAEFLKKSGLDLSMGTLNKLINKRRSVSETTENKIFNALHKIFADKYERKDVFPAQQK